MWKWLAGFAVVYGLLTVALTVGAGRVHARLDFTNQRTLLVTDPASRHEVIDEQESSQRFVRWYPGLGPEEMHFIATPMTCPTDATMAITTMRASQPCELLLGVREVSGAIYIGRLSVGPEWQEHQLALAELGLSPRSKDDNGQLDLAQIRGVTVILPPLGERGRQRWAEQLRHQTGDVNQPLVGDRPSTAQPPEFRNPGRGEAGRPRLGMRQPAGRRGPNEPSEFQPQGGPHPGAVEPPNRATPPPQVLIDIQQLEFVAIAAVASESR